MNKRQRKKHLVKLFNGKTKKYSKKRSKERIQFIMTSYGQLTCQHPGYNMVVQLSAYSEPSNSSTT